MTRSMNNEERAQQSNDVVEHLLGVYQEVIAEQRETTDQFRRQMARDQQTIDRLEALKDD